MLQLHGTVGAIFLSYYIFCQQNFEQPKGLRVMKQLPGVFNLLSKVSVSVTSSQAIPCDLGFFERGVPSLFPVEKQLLLAASYGHFLMSLTQ